ncbi:hypothetical protein ACVILL_004944 [Bradyrhizobium sp. USDA 3364]
MRWRVWITVASVVEVVVATPAVLPKNLRIEIAFVVSSEPWSITFSTSSGPRIAAVTCTPPVPQP